MGSGMCIVYAPNTFAHDDETKAIVVDPDGDPIDVDPQRRAGVSHERDPPRDRDDENDEGA